MSIFANPHTRYNEGRIQGYWFRWVLERPTVDGWVAALDSAAVRQNQNGHPFPKDLSTILCAHQLIEDSLAPRCDKRHLRSWDDGEEPPCFGDQPEDTSDHSQTWVGKRWLQGWPTEYPVFRGHMPWPTSPPLHPTWWNALDEAVERLAQQGYPFGMGWRMPTMQAGKEEDRRPWAQSGHTMLAMLRERGTAVPWERGTGRIVWAMMAYTTPAA
jgi:hypothetical protein